MIKRLRIVCFLLLVFNGVGALYGGWNLIVFPDGSSIHLSSSWLAHTPFDSYLIPGIVLFVVNGIFSFFVISMMLLKNRMYPTLIFMEGCLLTGWIFIQIGMIRMVYFLHYVMGGTGVLLMLCGYLLMKRIYGRFVLFPPYQ